MALTRKYLKGLGLTEEQVDSIIESHTEVTDALKAQITELQGKADKADGIQKELDGLKNGKDWKAEHDKLKKDFDDYKASVNAKETEAAKREAVREAAKKANLSEAGISKAVKYWDLSTVELDGEGKAKDADKLAESIKSEWGEFVATTQTRGAAVDTPPRTGKATRSKEEINAIKDTAERQKAIAENHEAFGF